MSEEGEATTHPPPIQVSVKGRRGKNIARYLCPCCYWKAATSEKSAIKHIKDIHNFSDIESSKPERTVICGDCNAASFKRELELDHRHKISDCAVKGGALFEQRKAEGRDVPDDRVWNRMTGRACRVVWPNPTPCTRALSTPPRGDLANEDAHSATQPESPPPPQPLDPFQEFTNSPSLSKLETSPRGRCDRLSRRKKFIYGF